MPRILSFVLFAAAASTPGFAASPFACKASGDTWTITGSPAHKAACALRCVVRDAAGDQDIVTCAPTVAPGPRTDPVCEGFLLGKHWTAATLVAAECANLEP